MLLVVADHEAVAQTLRDRPDGFRRTDRLEAIGLEMGLKGGLFGVNGDDWKRQRRMVMAAFDPGHVKAYYPALVKCGDRLAGRWQKAAMAGADIDLQADLMRFTVDAIAGLAFGTDVNTLESDDDVIQRHLDKIFPKLYTRIIAPLPYWRLFKLPSDRELERALAAVDAAIDGFIAAARQRLAADPAHRAVPQNLLEAMIVAADEPDSGIDDDQVAGNVMTMLLAGEDTTANTLAWAIWLLHRHPAGDGACHGRGARRDGRWRPGDAGAPVAAGLHRSLHARDHASEAGGTAAATAGTEGHGARRRGGARGHGGHQPAAPRQHRRPLHPRGQGLQARALAGRGRAVAGLGQAHLDAVSAPARGSARAATSRCRR